MSIISGANSSTDMNKLGSYECNLSDLAGRFAEVIRSGGVDWLLGISGAGAGTPKDVIFRALTGETISLSANLGLSVNDTEVPSEKFIQATLRHVEECATSGMELTTNGAIDPSKIDESDVDVILQYAVFGESKI